MCIGYFLCTVDLLMLNYECVEHVHIVDLLCRPIDYK